MRVFCPNCGNTFNLVKVLKDALGTHTVCPECGSSFDVDITNGGVLNITEDEFDDAFTMVENHIDSNASFDGAMFETYGEELEYIKEFAKTNPKRVWTIIEGDNGNLFYSTGVHLVNRIGYFITEEEFNCEYSVEQEDTSGSDEE